MDQVHSTTTEGKKGKHLSFAEIVTAPVAGMLQVLNLV